MSANWKKLDWDEIGLKAAQFSKRWRQYGKGNEKSEAQLFVTEFLKVFGIDWLAGHGTMEQKVDHEGFSDFIWHGKIIIEMKSKGADPGFKEATAQLARYTAGLTEDQRPALWMACDFDNVRLWNISAGYPPIDFKINKLRKLKKCFSIIAGHGEDAISRDKEGVNRLAAEKMARLHDELKRHGYSGQDLEIYLARLLFCLFANDTDIFEQDSLQEYIEDSSENGHDLDARLTQLFQDLNEPIEKRIPNSFFSGQIDATHFKHINGGLFEKPIRRAKFDKKMRQELLDCLDFDWSQIRPAIFGSMFQGVMDKDRRREIGAHYTSEENILKLINPLFMDALREEFAQAKKKGGQKSMADFHAKLASLKFLDPACGCGNFLIVAYRELRRLEINVVREEMRLSKTSGHRLLNIETHFRVGVEQFHGIEIEEWPCQIARTGMWLMDHLMNMEASEEFGEYYDRLPLTKSAAIAYSNAHRMDWSDLAPKGELSYILGNPPYVGYTYQSKVQKEDIGLTCLDKSGKPIRGVGKMDYVAAWFYRAAKYMQGTQIRAAFVSTNSIMQGEQLAAMWRPLIEVFGIHIDFAYRTFKWSNEAKGKAAVHCVIVGFSTGDSAVRFIYDGGERIAARNINPYIVDAQNIWVESRTRPLCNVPEMLSGNRPTDGGHLIIEKDDLTAFIEADPLSKKYIKRFMMGQEFINNEERYCLWLVEASPSELKKMPEVMKRVAACKESRLNSPDVGRKRLADAPTLFREQIAPDYFLVVPKVSSEKRTYIPIGYMDNSTIAGDKLFVVSDATLYHFGILMSNVHMAWTRAVCGRLEMRYSYSINIVYNNFPWPDAADKQKAEIEKLAQDVLDARAMHPESSLADLYDPLTMPSNLLNAHRALDKAVMKLYGLGKDMAEPEVVAALMERHQRLAKGS